MRDSTDESQRDPAATSLWSRDPEQLNSQQADFGQKSFQQQRAVEPQLERMESSHSPLAPAVLALQRTKDLEPRIRHLGDPGAATVSRHGSPPSGISGAPRTSGQDASATGREFSPKTTTSAPKQTGYRKSHEQHTLCRSSRFSKEHKDASLSNTRNKEALLPDPTAVCAHLSRIGSQPKTSLWASRGNQESEQTDKWREHVDPLYRAARPGCQPPREHTQMTSRTKPEKGRARVTSSQSNCSSQPGNTAGCRTALVVRTGGLHRSRATDMVT